MPTGTLVIYRSTDQCETWDPVLPADVPEWIKNNPEVLGHMVDGEAATSDEVTFYVAKRLLNPVEEAFPEKADPAIDFRNTHRLRLVQDGKIIPYVKDSGGVH